MILFLFCCFLFFPSVCGKKTRIAVISLAFLKVVYIFDLIPNTMGKIIIIIIKKT